MMNSIPKQFKIAFVNTEWLPVPPVKGGAVEEWIERIARELDRHHVCVFSIFDNALPRYNKDDHIEYFRFKPGLVSKVLFCTYKLPFKNSSSPLYYFSYSLWCALKLRNIRPHIIHIHNRPQFVWIIRLLNPAAKIILHIHQVSAMEEQNLWDVNFIRKVDLFLGCSRFIIDEIKKRYPLVKEKVKVIHNGVDIEEFKPVWTQPQARVNLRADFGLNSHKVILYVGRLAENKGVHILIEAFRNIVKSGRSDLKLFVCGGLGYSNNSITPYVKRLYDLAWEIKDNVVFTGYVPHSEIWKYYLFSDLVVIPSEVNEGFCVITIEGMAAGIPVIASDRGGISEAIKNRENGILIDNLSAETLKVEIMNFLNQKEVYLDYAAKGTKTVESYFTWDKVSANLTNIYLDLIKNA